MSPSSRTIAQCSPFIQYAAMPARTVRSQITSMSLENIEPYQDMDKISQCDIAGRFRREASR